MGWFNARVKVSVVTVVPPPPALFCSTLPHLLLLPICKGMCQKMASSGFLASHHRRHASGLTTPAASATLHLSQLLASLWCFPASHHRRYAHHSAPVLKPRTSMAHSPDHCLFSRSTFQHFVYCPFASVRFCLYQTCLCRASGKTCLPSVLDLRLPYNPDIACNMSMKVPTEIGIQGCVCVCVLDRTLSCSKDKLREHLILSVIRFVSHLHLSTWMLLSF